MKTLYILSVSILFTGTCLARVSRESAHASAPMAVDQIEQTINGICKKHNISGFNAPSEDIDKVHREGGNATYGEITPAGLSELIKHLEPITEQDLWVDLGSGVGKVVIQVVLETLASALGAELAHARIEGAQRVKQELVNQGILKDPSRLTFKEENITKTPLNEATIVFMCSTCFSDELMNAIVNNAKSAPRLRYLISLKPLPAESQSAFALKETLTLPMTWSSMTPVNIYVPVKKPINAKVRIQAPIKRRTAAH